MTFWQRIKKWLAPATFQDGRDWVIMEIKRGTPIEEIENFIQSSIDFGTYSDFDKGAQSALIDYLKLNSTYRLSTGHGAGINPQRRLWPINK